MIPRRITSRKGRVAMVDGIPFELPIVCAPSPALMAAFTIDADRARPLMPGTEIFPLRLWNGRGVLLLVVIDYQQTTIGKYIEFSVGIACTQGRRPTPPLLPAALNKLFGTGQFVLDLPVSTEISVKGGKGIWGMPKHRASLDFRIEEATVSSMYALDGQEVLTIEIDRSSSPALRLEADAANYCAFRGMLMKSRIYFTGKAHVRLNDEASARLHIGPHPRLHVLKELDVSANPLMTAFIPESRGTLDDHIEAWFLDYEALPGQTPEGLESVVHLGLGQEWPEPPPR